MHVIVGESRHNRLRNLDGKRRINNPEARFYYLAYMETPVVFNCKGQQIIGILHLPDGRTKVPGVLLLHGFTGHKAEIHRMLVKLARKLAAHGIGCLRFDFRGCGDSAGEFEEMTLRTKLCDATVALKFLARLSVVIFPCVQSCRL